MNKKKIALYLSLIMLSSFTLSACNSKSANDSSTSPDTAQITPGQGQGQGRGRGLNGTPPADFKPGDSIQMRDSMQSLAGTIIDISDSLFTLKIDDSSSKIIILSSSTAYRHQDQEASFSDLKVGDTILVRAVKNDDSTLTARNIQLDPEYHPEPPVNPSSSELPPANTN